MANNQRSDHVHDSRFSIGGITEVKGDRIGFWERTIFPKHPSDIPFKLVAKYARRPDLLAFDMYGRSNLQWFVLQYNNISDINTDFIEGKEISLPTKGRLFGQLLSGTK